MAVPAVYLALTAITQELSQVGIPKTRVNIADGYRYRSIDDVMGVLSPLLSRHRLCVLPRVTERTVVELDDQDRSRLFSVVLRVAFELVSSEDGSVHRVEVFSEALDCGDKATAKALSAAYKSAMVQVFCIPDQMTDDPDAVSFKPRSQSIAVEPLQGWNQWVLDIGDILGVCESPQAVDLVQDRNRQLLIALSRERPDLYAELGQSFTSSRDSIRTRQQSPERLDKPDKAKSRRRAGLAAVQNG